MTKKQNLLFKPQMYNKNNTVTKKINIKNMLSICCVRMLRHDFENHNITVNNIGVGFAEISYNPEKISNKEINRILAVSGLSIISNREEKVVEEIKLAVTELVHYMNNADSIAKKSEYIVGKLGLNYRYLSRLFSKYENITLEKYIILNKIERIKNLIDEDEYTLSEIAYMMDYSSVQYLSAQFKKETGYSVSDYKLLEYKEKKSINELF
ncbi:MAG: helix-turn-helix transcriptional regulator [Bacteroidales bacterium]|nr:helix-turn-helix transcriptional regulator [Bacteroidales bacterium]